MGLCDLDFGLPGPDFGLADRLFALPDPLLDLEALCLGLPEVLDFGLEKPDLLLCTDPDRDLLDRCGEFDLLLETFEAFEDLLD